MFMVGNSPTVSCHSDPIFPLRLICACTCASPHEMKSYISTAKSYIAIQVLLCTAIMYLRKFLHIQALMYR